MDDEGGEEVVGGEEEEGTSSTLSVRNFLAARIQEINSLSVQIGNAGVPSTKRLAFQHVPKHMRRRAVSHNVKRLPKRLQGIHRSQIDKSSGGVVKKPKRPSRKHRRRKSNLLQEYNRRQREHKWLETHIWHAKRFHMEDKWGYKMPMAPTDKGYRALYRAAKSFCSMRDVSFYSCLELEGPTDLISETFSRCFAPKSCNPLSLKSEMYKDGLREGTMYFYKSGEYPFGYVGKLRFQWRRDMKALWLWVLPAHKQEVIEELCNEFDMDKELVWRKTQNLDERDAGAMEVDSKSSCSSKDSNAGVSIDEIKLEPKRLMTRPKWTNVSTNVTLSDLEGVFNRIRLYGPLATRTLKETLEVLTPAQLMSSELPIPDSNLNCSKWWLDYFSEKRKSVVLEQVQLWTQLKKFHDVPRCAIIPLTVRDPRIMIPQKRTMPEIDVETGKETKEEESNESLMQTQPEEEDLTISDNGSFENTLKRLHMVCGEFLLEDEELRHRLVREKMTDAVFNKKRSELLIPGSKIELGIEENKIPILLVHRPNSFSFSNGGWDVIIPAGWAMQFWVAFSYRCVRALGFRDAFHYEFESGTIHTSNEDGSMLPPDSNAGKTEATIRESSAESNYFKYPPAKRANLIKLRCPFPFKIEWEKLLRLADPQAEDNIFDQYFVLRDRDIISELRRSITKQKISAETLTNMITTLSHKDQCLVGVKLVIKGKGLIEEGAVICIPTSSDLNLLSKDKKLIQELIQVEPGDDTVHHNLRNELRKKHTEFLSTSRNQRKRLKKRISTRNEHEILQQVKHFQEASQLACEFYDNEMKKLWLPNVNETLSNMDRIPIGFIEYGAECYSLGKQSGLGYCSLTGLLKLCEEVKEPKHQGLVLVRCCRSNLIYRFARIQVCELT